jgi:hypothetical protein
LAEALTTQAQTYEHDSLTSLEKRTMIRVVLAMILMSLTIQENSSVSKQQKEAFIQLLQALPTKGEFFTDEAVKEAGPYISVLFALTESDVENYDLYGFLAISRGLSEDAKYRRFGVQNFNKIQHKKLKLFWAAVLFDQGSSSPLIEQFLRDALASPEQSKDLSEMMGPGFDALRKKLMNP